MHVYTHIYVYTYMKYIYIHNTYIYMSVEENEDISNQIKDSHYA